MKFLFLAISLMVSLPSLAGNQNGGTVTNIFVRAGDGLIYFTLSGVAKVGSPTCATQSYWIIRNENSNAGKQQYAMVLSAQASGKKLNVAGANTCARWGDGEQPYTMWSAGETPIGGIDAGSPELWKGTICLGTRWTWWSPMDLSATSC